MIALPTRNGFLMLLLCAASLASALLNIGLLTAIVAAVLIGITLSSFIMAQFAGWGVTVSRPGSGSVGGTPAGIALPLVVRNHTRFRRSPLLVAERLPFLVGKEKLFLFPVPELAPRERLVLRREVSPTLRGHWHLRRVVLSGTDPCGLFRRRRGFRLPEEVVISPEIVSLEMVTVHNERDLVSSGEGSPLGVAGVGNDFFGIRPYRPGDEIRRVHWKGTAARGMMMVKEFEAADSKRITLVLDTELRMTGFDPAWSNFEFLIKCAASISAWLGSQYYRLVLYTAFGDRGDPIRIGGDSTGLQQRLEELFTELKPTATPPERLLAEAIEDIPDGTTLFLLTMSHSPQLIELVRMLSDSSCRVHWLYAPKQLFPPVEPDSPRIAVRSSIHVPSDSPVEPSLLDFSSDLVKVIERETEFEGF